jgi:DNA modification methylase
MESHEFIIHVVKGDAKLYINPGMGRPSNVFIAGNKYKKVAGKGHPTAKPVDLCKELIEFGSKENDFVLDPFAGSGATLLGAMDSRRRWYGIEIEPEYYTEACGRLACEGD